MVIQKHPTRHRVDGCEEVSVEQWRTADTIAPRPDLTAAQARRSRLGLRAMTFFWACGIAAVGPFLSTLLAERGWRYDSIGLALACIGAGITLMQTPAGIVADRIHQHRWLLVAITLAAGIGYAVLPHVSPSGWVMLPLLLGIGVAQAFHFPLQGAVMMRLAGHHGFSQLVGTVNACNQLGNVAAALIVILAAGLLGLPGIFAYVGLACGLSALMALSIRTSGVAPLTHPSSVPDAPGTVWRDRRVFLLAMIVMLYSIANGPMLAMAGLYVRHLHGTDTQVASLILAAQAVMIPTSLLAGRLCVRWGCRSMLLLATIVLTIRIGLYALVSDPWAVVAIETLDGAAAGLYGVAVISLVADLARGRGGFNALNGFIATAASLGGVVGPIVVGWLVQHWGFTTAFATMAGVAGLVVGLIILILPEGPTTTATPASERLHLA